jgi:hypothetical protein
MASVISDSVAVVSYCKIKHEKIAFFLGVGADRSAIFRGYWKSGKTGRKGIPDANDYQK